MTSVLLVKGLMGVAAVGGVGTGLFAFRKEIFGENKAGVEGGTEGVFSENSQITSSQLEKEREQKRLKRERAIRDEAKYDECLAQGGSSEEEEMAKGMHNFILGKSVSKRTSLLRKCIELVWGKPDQ